MTQKLIALLVGDLTEAAATLRRYEAQHWAKGTAESDLKAAVNAKLAARFERTLAEVAGTKAEPIAAEPEGFKVGDVVRITASNQSSFYVDGAICRLTRRDAGGDWWGCFRGLGNSAGSFDDSCDARVVPSSERLRARRGASMTAPTPHKHAALIKAWADDPSQAVWSFTSLEWRKVDTPSWCETSAYALGDKPAAPPRRMCTLAGVEFPMPETEAPAPGVKVYVPDTYPVQGCKPTYDTSWNGGDGSQLIWLKLGMVHLTKEAAEAHADALIAATKQAIEAAR